MSNAHPTPKSKVIATYDYVDEHGTLLGQVLRKEPKAFTQRRPKDGGWEYKAPERKVPFHLPQLLEADPNAWVFIVEGEEDVLALESIGLVATCNMMGAKKDLRPYVEFFRGRCVAIIPDNDDDGATHATNWESALHRVTRDLLRLPPLTPDIPKSDPRDWVRSGGTGECLLETLQELQTLRRLRVSSTQARGEKTLDELERFIRRFLVYPTTHEYAAHVLWIMHTWSMELWDSTPRIAFLSPEPQSGKTRALEVTEKLVPRPKRTVNNSTMYLYREISNPEGRPTILYDEIDTIFGPKAKGDEDARAMLNAGHRKGATAGRCVIVGNEVKTEDFPAYCAVAIAGLGYLPDTIISRSIRIGLHRRSAHEPIEQFRDRLVNGDVTILREKISTLMEDLYKSMDGYYPEFPEGVENRDADVWEPLLIIADIIGGSWPQRARAAATYLVKKSKEVPLSLNLRLLKDIRLIWGDRSKMSTQQIIDELGELEEAAWNEINRGHPMTTADLGKRLRNYDIKTTVLNLGGARSVRGYYREDMQEIWLRYLGSVNPEPEELQTRYPAPAVEKRVTPVIPVINTPNGVDPDPRPY